MESTNPTATVAARLKVRLGVAQKSCATCKNFDRPAGTSIIQKQNPAFAAAANILSPGQMLSEKRKDFDEEGLPREPEEAISRGKKRWDWTQFGLCHIQNVVVHEDYWCGGPDKGKDEKDTWE